MSSSAHAKLSAGQRSKWSKWSGEDPSEESFGKKVEGGIFISDEQLARFDSRNGHARAAIRTMLMDARTPKIIRGPSHKPADVRIAGVKDEDAVISLTIMDLKENAICVAPIDQDSVVTLVRTGTRKEGGIVSVIDGPDGKPVATQIIVPEKWWWSRAYHLVKMVDYVHPDHRKSTHAAHLIEFSKWCADTWTQNFGYPTFILLGVLSTVKTRGKVRLYGKHATPIGATFLYPYPPLGDEPSSPFRDI